MTDKTAIVNRALQSFGTRTTVTSAELAAGSSNEAIQANLIYDQFRDILLRMAPWNCGMNTANLTYITSVPGTPENMSPATANWQKGQPPPPWTYEYQYPVDCLRACWIIPANQTGFSSLVPITTAVIGPGSAFWQGGPVRYRVMIDQFRPVTAAAVAAGGAGYAIGDQITLASGAVASPPIGAPVVLEVTGVAAGAVTTVSVVNQVLGSTTPQGGSYFAVQANPVAQGSTTGAGTGATFNLTFGAKSDQRVIVCNQQNATLAYIRQVIDPNVMDPHFQEAWIKTLGAGMCKALTGNLGLSNGLIKEVNSMIAEARKSDGNEGLTVNDVTPDWIRFRGINWPNEQIGPYADFQWGNFWPLY